MRQISKWLFRIPLITATIGVVAVYSARLLVDSPQIHHVVNTVGVILIPASVLLGLAEMVFRFRTNSRRRKELWQSGAQGRAQVRTIKSRVSKDTASCVLDVWVMPVAGTPAFEAILTTTAPKYWQPRVGDLINVRFDPANPTAIIADQHQGLT